MLKKAQKENIVSPTNFRDVQDKLPDQMEFLSTPDKLGMLQQRTPFTLLRFSLRHNDTYKRDEYVLIIQLDAECKTQVQTGVNRKGAPIIEKVELESGRVYQATIAHSENRASMFEELESLLPISNIAFKRYGKKDAWGFIAADEPLDDETEVVTPAE